MHTLGGAVMARRAWLAALFIAAALCSVAGAASDALRVDTTVRSGASSQLQRRAGRRHRERHGRFEEQVDDALHAQSTLRILRAALEDTGSSTYETSVIAWIMGVLPILVFALFYRSYKGSVMSCIQATDDYDRVVGAIGPEGKARWAYGLFECFQAPGMCCFSCCCGVVRWADTMAMAGFFGFMFGVIALLLVMGIGNITGAYVITVAFLVYYRQQLRAKFSITNGTCKTILGDIGAYCCCMPCAIAQEARVAELALAQGYVGIKDYLQEEGTWEHRLNETLSEEKAKHPNADVEARPPKQQKSACMPVCR